jgi:hypothetical protein
LRLSVRNVCILSMNLTASPGPAHERRETRECLFPKSSAVDTLVMAAGKAAQTRKLKATFSKSRKFLGWRSSAGRASDL